MTSERRLSRTTRAFLVFAALSVTLSASPALAWWSGWYSPNFRGSYSPSGYQHGQWDTTLWGTPVEAFGSQMQWNQTRADGVRNYSRNRRWIWFCGYCYAYYGHDHKDMSNKLNAFGYASNMPNPKYDWDDDNRDGRWEELEVSAIDSNFPNTNTAYWFFSYFSKSASGSGTLYETPQVSARNAVSGEYDVYQHDSSQTLGYYTYSFGPAKEQLTEAYTTTLSTEKYPVQIRGRKGANFMETSLVAPIQTQDELTEYIEWAKTNPVKSLRDKKVKQVLTNITFKQPLPFEVVRQLLGKGTLKNIGMVKAIYVADQNPDPNANVWTIQTVVPEGSDYEMALAEFVTNLNSNGLEGANSLKLQGVIAVQAWLPLDTVEMLNGQEQVLLADTAPSYTRTIAATSDEAQQIRKRNKTSKKGHDEVESFIMPAVSDLYSEYMMRQP